MKKYEFVPNDTIIIASGTTVKRIRALVHIPVYAVSRGDLGGYIQCEENLAQTDDAWVNDNACVYENAVVINNAYVGGDSRVFGNAMIRDNSCVDENAQISGNVEISGDAHIRGTAQIYSDEYEHVCIGGNAVISGNAKIWHDDFICWFNHVGLECQNNTLTAFNTSDGTIKVTRGSFLGTIDEFLAVTAQEYTPYDEDEEENKRINHEYKLLLEVATSRIKTAQSYSKR